MPPRVGLCGKEVCVHICSRVCYCPVGLELSYRRLRARRIRRDVLRVAVGQLEENIRRNAGSFAAFSQKLAWERQQKGKEVLCAQQQWR